MLKISLLMLIAISMISTSAFAEPTIELDVSDDEIKASDSIWISGKIIDVSQFKPVKLRVIGPDGSLIFAPQVSIEKDGEFRKLLNTPIPSFSKGTYLVTATHEDIKMTAQTQFVVTTQDIPRSAIIDPIQGKMNEETKMKKTTSENGMVITADAINGSDVITITGNTTVQGTDVTLIVKSPMGNLVTIAQISPDSSGDFEVEIKTGGQIWKEDGVYTITANQGTSSEYKESIQVEIKDGVVVPEFGIIATMILAVSIISIIIVSTKTKLAILPRY